MPISPYVAKLREVVGNDLLLLPSVSILPRDEKGRVLLVTHADAGLWGIIGGTVEPDESPEAAAIRETKEETGLDVAVSLRTVLGGPEYRVTYPNGDVGAFVIAVYEAHVTGGEPAPDGDETTAVEWFALTELRGLDLNPLALALLRDLSYINT